jgi:hypothetical protein
MKSFLNYLIESSQTYHYVIKFVHKIDDDQINTIETYLNRFDLIDISPLEEIENDNMDFYNNSYKTIYSLEVELGMPVSSYVLLQDLHSALHLNERDMIVRGASEPVQVATEDSLFRNKVAADAAEKGLVSKGRLSTDRFYDDAEQPPQEDVFGDQYNKKLLDYLADIAETRPSNEVEPSAPLFSWLEMKNAKKPAPDTDQDLTDFNAGHDTPKPVYKKVNSNKTPIDPKFTGSNGNFDDGVTHNTAFFKDAKNGKPVTVTAPRAAGKSKGK